MTRPDAWLVVAGGDAADATGWIRADVIIHGERERDDDERDDERGATTTMDYGFRCVVRVGHADARRARRVDEPWTGDAVDAVEEEHRAREVGVGVARRGVGARGEAVWIRARAARVAVGGWRRRRTDG